MVRLWLLWKSGCTRSPPCYLQKLCIEKSWKKDLLETDFINKIVEKSHYYCPLNKVAKSLTFLLEIGWTVIDARLEKSFGKAKSTSTRRHRKDNHRQGKSPLRRSSVDLKDLVGAFNRREQFVELSPNTVALIDRQEFAQQWGDLAEQEIVSEGISLKKNQFGLLQPFLDQPCREGCGKRLPAYLN